MIDAVAQRAIDIAHDGQAAGEQTSNEWHAENMGSER